MEAKDTIMSDKQIRATCLGEKSYWTGEMGENAATSSPPVLLPQFRRIAAKQAVITWKARQLEIDEAYEAGMREVVESYRRENPSRYKEYETWWQDFVKREGL